MRSNPLNLILSGINTIFYKGMEFLFLAVIMFISFLSLRTPYEQLEQELKDKGDRKFSDLNIFRRFFSFFFFGAPLIYFGLKISALRPLNLDFSAVNNVFGFFIYLFSIATNIAPNYYVLVLIPFFIIIVLKFQLEKIWYDLNKESMKLFNMRLVTFRDYKMVKRMLPEVKKVHEKEFKKLTIKIVKKSRILYTIYGLFLIFLTSTFFASNTQLLMTYLIPLLAFWALICCFLTIFEKTISDFIVDSLDAANVIKK